MPIQDRINDRMECKVPNILNNQMPEYIGNMFDGQTRTVTKIQDKLI